MGKKRDFSPAGIARPWESKAANSEANISEPWADGVIKGLRQGSSFLVLGTNPSASENDRRYIDDQFARIAMMQSEINGLMAAGKEIGALKDLIGYPPYTFSEVYSFYRGAVVSLVQSWEEEGMQTLVDGITIFPPNSVQECRQAVLYGIGDMEDLSSLESAFLDYFRPVRFAKCFSDAVEETEGPPRATQFFVQWELTQTEAAFALGVSEDSPEFEAVMDQLESQATSLRQPPKQRTSHRESPLRGRGGL